MDFEEDITTDSENTFLLDQEYYEECMNKMEHDIRELWENVIVPYLNNYNSNYLLDKLTSKDFDKFREFMIYNNPNCCMIYDNYRKCISGDF